MHDDPALSRALEPDVEERGFERRVIRIEPGARRDYDDAEWFDALVVVTSGRVELEGAHGGALTIHRGDVLWLSDLPLRALHNRADVAAVLVAVTRRPPTDDAGTADDVTGIADGAPPG